MATGNWTDPNCGQLQLVVRSFAVGFSSVLVIFSVQWTGPVNTTWAWPTLQVASELTVTLATASEWTEAWLGSMLLTLGSVMLEDTLSFNMDLKVRYYLSSAALWTSIPGSVSFWRPWLFVVETFLTADISEGHSLNVQTYCLALEWQGHLATGIGLVLTDAFLPVSMFVLERLAWPMAWVTWVLTMVLPPVSLAEALNPTVRGITRREVRKVTFNLSFVCSFTCSLLQFFSNVAVGAAGEELTLVAALPLPTGGTRTTGTTLCWRSCRVLDIWVLFFETLQSPIGNRLLVM